MYNWSALKIGSWKSRPTRGSIDKDLGHKINLNSIRINPGKLFKNKILNLELQTKIKANITRKIWRNWK